ncbi:hypothetical protein Hypma_011270 [Hypsizygus marmoreus]|uniref:Uncharacterized protein n=1 Tax=Hypsizygus marmoreus TaxID=39966 RepID=A0A369JPS1_HYPMA|nr:hypothetical protein Hypma_011270 [Hypsizygus marmoreus]
MTTKRNEAGPTIPEVTVFKTQLNVANNDQCCLLTVTGDDKIRSLRRLKWRSSRLFDSSSPRVARQSNAVSLPLRPPCSSITGLLPIYIERGPEPPPLPVTLCIVAGLPAALWMYKVCALVLRIEIDSEICYSLL